MPERAGCNQVRLSGELFEREVIRHTPAGVPVLEFRMRHASSLVEAGVPRRVEMEIQAVAVGAVADRLAVVPIGRVVMVVGFIANRGRRSLQIVLHVNEFEIE